MRPRGSASGSGRRPPRSPGPGRRSGRRNCPGSRRGPVSGWLWQKEILNFCHDLLPELAIDEGHNARKNQSGTALERPWRLAAWPNVPTRFLPWWDTRSLPADFQLRMVQERLGILPHEMDSGPPVRLRPSHELVQRPEAYLPELAGGQAGRGPVG